MCADSINNTEKNALVHTTNSSCVLSNSVAAANAAVLLLQCVASSSWYGWHLMFQYTYQRWNGRGHGNNPGTLLVVGVDRKGETLLQPGRCRMVRTAWCRSGFALLLRLSCHEGRSFGVSSTVPHHQSCCVGRGTGVCVRER